MSNIGRAPRGRPSKVTKPLIPNRRPGRHQQHHLQQAASGALQAAAALHHDADAHGLDASIDDGLEDAEAEPELDDGVHQHPHVATTLELSEAANILANGGPLPSAEVDPQAHPSDYPASPPDFAAQQLAAGTLATADMARESYGEIVIESALAKRLAGDRAFRAPRQRRPEQALNLTRRSNVEALFAHIAGEEVTSSCKNCHKGHGPWTACVVVDGQMCGSCANCWFNASGARCSFHGRQAAVPSYTSKTSPTNYGLVHRNT
jgi:hypothetical protein